MGAIYDTAELIGKNKDNLINNMMDMSKISAITKMAKDAIHTYPAIISEGVVADNEDLVYSICNFLETQYAIFTMIAMGMDPIFDGVNAHDHVLKFYSAESDDLIESADKSNTFVKIGKDNVKMSIESLKEYKFSSEAEEGELNPDQSGEDGEGENKNKSPSFITTKFLKIEKKARMTDPTMINVKLKMGSNRHEVEFPLAIKTIPRFITSEESSGIFTHLSQNKPISLLVRLMSGELSLFKDIIFQLEKAKKDKELYSKLGRHPWFRELLKRKTEWRLVNFLKTMFKLDNKANVLPIYSLVVTKDELEKGFNGVWEKIKRTEELNILDKLMLLSLVVVDTTTATVEFSFYGLKTNTIVKEDSLIKDYKNGGKDEKGKDMESLLKTLIYKL